MIHEFVDVLPYKIHNNLSGYTIYNGPWRIATGFKSLQEAEVYKIKLIKANQEKVKQTLKN